MSHTHSERSVRVTLGESDAANAGVVLTYLFARVPLSTLAAWLGPSSSPSSRGKCWEREIDRDVTTPVTALDWTSSLGAKQPRPLASDLVLCSAMRESRQVTAILHQDEPARSTGKQAESSTPRAAGNV